MSLVLQSSGGGSVSIVEPTTASNFTQTLPASTGTVMVSGNMPAFSAKGDAGQTISTSTFTKVTLGTENWDTNNNFASSRFTPTVAGYYQVNASINYAGTALGGNVIIAIYKNGGEVYRGNRITSSAAGAETGIVGCVQLSMNGSTDYIELYTFQNSGGNLTLFSGLMDGCLVRTA